MPNPMNPEKKSPTPKPEKQADKPKTGTSWGSPGLPKSEPAKKPTETPKPIGSPKK